MADLGKEFVELDRTLHAHVESGNSFQRATVND